MYILSRPVNGTALLMIYIAALAVRAIVFEIAIMPYERYKQPDTLSYFYPALSLALGRGMTNVRDESPIFWRTPGYPAFLAPFYALHGVSTTNFNAYHTAHHAALLVQIALCSAIPVVSVLLAYRLFALLPIAWVTGLLAMVHPGLVLASGYLMTDGLATLLFLCCLWCISSAYYWPQRRQRPHVYKYIIGAAVLFGLFTWLRPMGQFLIVVMGGLFLVERSRWRVRLFKMFLFFSIGMATLTPWYIRNYLLTERLFFCPMAGCMLNVFAAPKICRRLTGEPYETCWKRQLQQGGREVAYERRRIAATGKALVIPEHAIVGRAAWPLIKAHSWWFVYDWLVQVVKTTFDLTASQQLVRFVQGTFFYDELEEFLTDKLVLCLWGQPMPWWLRVVCWAEAFLSLLKWFGLFIGAWIFAIAPCLRRLSAPFTRYYVCIWWWCTVIIGATLIMTGAFGYARLRLPVDILLIVLSVSAWYYKLRPLLVQWRLVNPQNLDPADEEFIRTMAD